jgi:hypothetical protein
LLDVVHGCSQSHRAQLPQPEHAEQHHHGGKAEEFLLPNLNERKSKIPALGEKAMGGLKTCANKNHFIVQKNRETCIFTGESRFSVHYQSIGYFQFSKFNRKCEIILIFLIEL